MLEIDVDRAQDRVGVHQRHAQRVGIVLQAVRSARRPVWLATQIACLCWQTISVSDLLSVDVLARRRAE